MRPRPGSTLSATAVPCPAPLRQVTAHFVVASAPGHAVRVSFRRRPSSVAPGDPGTSISGARTGPRLCRGEVWADQTMPPSLRGVRARSRRAACGHQLTAPAGLTFTRRGCGSSVGGLGEPFERRWQPHGSYLPLGLWGVEEQSPATDRLSDNRPGAPRRQGPSGTPGPPPRPLGTTGRR